VSNELFEAIRTGDHARVGALLDADPALVNAKNEQGVSAYPFARYARQDAIARMLTERGAELDIFGAILAGAEDRVTDLLAGNRELVNSYSQDGWTPLHMAAFFGQPALAEILLANGADVHARSRNAMDNTPLHAGVAGRATEVVAVLLAHGANVNARQQSGWTPLHSAAQNGQIELAGLLLAHGADVHARADNNQTALDLAMTKGHQAMADLLNGGPG
jgi:ankyrin repeat protein